MKLMIDLETTGTKPGCGILSIGAVVFDSQGFIPKGVDTNFSVAVIPDSNLEIGLTHDKETIKWWQEQSKEAYAEAWERSDAHHISSALAKFSVFLAQLKGDTEYWVNGASFDYPILQEAYAKAGLEYPIPFRKQCCYRTLKNLFPYVTPLEVQGAVKHSAYWDAVYQAQHCEALLGWSRRFQKAEAPTWP
jgi:DNA polymerase III epsilon subunit-like protein